MPRRVMARMSPLRGAFVALLLGGLAGVAWWPDNRLVQLSLLLGVVGSLVLGRGAELQAEITAETSAQLEPIERAGRRLLWLLIPAVLGCLSLLWIRDVWAGWAPWAAALFTAALLTGMGGAIVLRRRYFRVLDNGAG